jgi:hypothetical protein
VQALGLGQRSLETVGGDDGGQVEHGPRDGRGGDGLVGGGVLGIEGA